jgi:hypothetical protein
MVQPINYLQNVQDPFAQAVQGLQLGTGIANIYAQREADEQKRVQQALAQAEQQRYQTDISTFFTTPPAERKYENLERLFMGANKQQFDALQAVGKTMTDEKLATSKRFTGQVLSALESNPESAKQLLRQYAEAETDPMQKTAWQDTLKLAEVSPDQAIKSIELIGGASFGKDWYETISNVRKSRREEAQAPGQLRKINADAIVEEAKAKYAPQKFGLEIDLTQSQIKQADAAVRASDAAAKLSGAQATRADAEAAQMAMGVIPADKRTAAEAQFRKEYSDQTKGYQDIKAAYGRILAVSDPKTPDEEAAADLALVFNFMKMQDPGSTVNSGEFANAQNSVGVGDRVVNLYNNLLKGSRLNPSQRKSFRGQAENLYKVTGQQEDIVRQGIGRIATGYGLNLNNIFYTQTEVAPVALRTLPAETPLPPAPAPARSNSPAAGQRNVTVDY